MELKIYSDYNELSHAVADQLVNLIKNKPDAVICMASGETPRLTCRLFVEKAMKEKLEVSRISFIGLDEWVGISPENHGSCHYFFTNELFEKLNFSPNQLYLFDGMNDDLATECRKMDEVVQRKGGIDLMIVGIGMNGHIGFNEPHLSFENYAHVADLDETTTSVGQKYFDTAMELRQGITLGLKHLQESKKVILIANGSKKAPVVERAINGIVDSSFPASIMQTHANGIVMVDKEAAAKLSTGNNSSVS